MKKYLYIVVLFVIIQNQLLAQEYWLKQKSPTLKDLHSCFFSDTLNGWIGGDSGLILHTSNNGSSWISQNSGVLNSVFSVYFLNKLNGFALSLEFGNDTSSLTGSRILSTSDGGNSWSNYFFPVADVYLNSIYFSDSLNGYTGGSDGIVYYTTNKGADWLSGIIDSGFTFGFPILDIDFYDSKVGYASGGWFDIVGQIFKTTDGGITWKSKVVGPEPVKDLYVIDELNVFGAGGDYEYGASVVRTSTSGSVWNYTELGIIGISNAIGFRTNSEGWISLGIIDSFLVSTNGGVNWSLTATPGKSLINDLLFTNSRNGWAVGRDGAILKFNSSIINIFNENTFSPVTFNLHQNYPNPFNPNTVIEYEFGSDVNRFYYTELKIYDITGKELAILINEYRPAGLNKIIFDGSKFNSGIYFYRVTVWDNERNEVYTQSKKMILLK